MSEVSRLCDRIAIMNHGNILAEGTISELGENHDEPDLEELFYRLISKSEKEESQLVQ